MTDAGFVIVPVTDSFGDFFREVAGEYGVECRIVFRDELRDVLETERPLVVAVAAGGKEDVGLDVLQELVDAGADPTYLVGANDGHRFGVESVRRGAADYFCLPGDADLLRRVWGGRVEAARAREQAASPGNDVFGEFVGDSAALADTLARAARVMEHRDVTILVQGETGTGKEVLARAIHRGGPRQQSPFVAVNCAAIPSALLESELFGHVKGAFTDAHVSKSGLFEEADTGTLFLDEVGHLPLVLQGKLLRVLEDRRVRRVGAVDDRIVDVRIMAATHVDLKEAVRRGEFREDLYYRLNVVTLWLPPLRERAGDLETLAHHFVEQLSRRYGLPVPKVNRAFLAALRGHDWPGNIRELRHAIERALLLSPPGTLDTTELQLGSRPAAPNAGPLPFPARLDEISGAAARAMIDVYDGNKSAAARRLGISRPRLQRLLDGGEDDR